MTIINKGILDSEDLYERSLANDWPTAQQLTTADVFEVGSNVYFSNAKVQAYLDAEGYTAGQAGTDLSGNTTTDLAEGDNLYYTNTRVQSYLDGQGYTAGQAGTDLSGNTTTDLAEGNNLYYTNARVQTYVESLNYITGIDLSGNTTADLAESSGNLYYTNSRVLSHLAISDVTTKNLTIEGNLSVVGNISYLQVQNLEIEDNMVYLNANSTTTNPDLGWSGNYNDGTYAHAGIFRDATDGVFKFYEGYTLEPDESPYIDTTHASFQLANITARTFIGPVIGTVSSLSNHTTATLLEQENLYYTNTRVQAYLDGQGYSSGVTGTDLSGNTTTDLSEGNNLYYTNSRVQTYLESQGVGATNTTISGGVSTSITRIYFGDNTTTQFAVTEGVSANNLLVFENGVAQLPITDYTVSGNILTFITAPETNVLIQIRELEGAASITVGNVSLTNATTSDLTEGNNLYYTNTRVQAYLDGQGYSAGETGTDLSSNTTTDLAEGNNLYYTNTRVQAYLDGQGYSAGETGTDLSSNTTTDLAEGNNLYYTNSRVLAHLAESNVQVKSITTTEAGTPSITSSTSINLSANASAGGAVVIQNSALRIKSYSTVDRSNLTPSTGDVIYNTTDSSLQVYKGSAWSNVGSLSSLVGFDTDDLAEGSNLYYTNTRVQAYLDGQGYSTGSGGTDLSGNTTTDLAEGTNLYYTNSRARTAFTAGSGILIASGSIAVDTGVINVPAEQSYDIATDNSAGYMVTDSMESGFTISSTSTYRHLLKSLLFTNISQNTAYLQANLVYDGVEYEIANTFEIPYGFSTDMRFNSEILMPGMVIKLKSLNNSKVAANDVISSYISYKTVEDISYNSIITSTSPGSYSTVYTADADTIIESIKIYNLDGTNQRATILLKDNNSTVAYIAANTLLAHNYISEILENPLRMSLGQTIDLQMFGGRGTVVVSGRKSESYTITSNVETISEGQSVTFTIATLNIADGATRYFRTQGNVSSADFNEGNTGSFTVLNDSATVTLTANLDQSIGITEAGEQFRLVVAKTSPTGTASGTSNVISIIDTSNSIGVTSLTLTSNLLYETEATTITVNTVNATGNAGGTLYYTITGNADIYSNTSGAIIINDNTANLELITEASVSSDEVRTFAVQFRSSSVSGTILDTTENIYVQSLGETSITATGGNVLIIEI